MKKFNVMIGTFLAGGMLLAGCTIEEDDPREVQAMEEDQSQMDKIAEIIEEETELDFLKKKTITHTEYLSLEGYISSLVKNWKEDSEYRKVNYSAEYTIGSAAVAYINYFEDEITDLGLNEDFDEFQLLAHNLAESYETPDQEEHAKKFEEKMNDIVSKMKRIARYETIEEWVAASGKILSKPLDNPTLSAANNDEGLEYALKAQKVMDAFPLDLLTTGSEVEEIHSKVSLLSNEISNLQFVRTVQWNGEDQVEELPVSQWKDVDDEMRWAFEELKQIIHEL